jgi:hypothetical protein
LSIGDSGAEDLAGRLVLALRPLLLNAAIGLFLIVRIMAVLYDRPFVGAALRRNPIATRPILFFLAAVFLHAISVMSVEAFTVMRLAEAPVWAKLLASACLLLSGLPAWLIITHPLSFYRRCKSLKETESTPSTPMLRRVVTAAGDCIGRIGLAVHEIRIAIRNRS